MGAASIRRRPPGRGGVKTMADALQYRADNYRRFLPDWPALWQSFERSAKALRESQSSNRPKGTP